MITLVPIGEVERSTLEALGQSLPGVFGQSVQQEDGILLPERSWNQHRGQYFAPMLLAELSLPSPGDRVLGVADVDIFAPGLNFVFVGRQTLPGEGHSSR
jgi:predicted Zn-dependent protease